MYSKNKEKIMNILVVFPPCSSPISPYLSVPLLVGQLESAGYKATCLDLNAEFFYYILQKPFLMNSLQMAEEILKSLQANPENKLSIQDFDDCSLEDKIKIIKRVYIKHELAYNKNLYKKTIKEIDSAVAIMKSEKDFYNPNKFKKAHKILENAFKLATLPYCPCVSSSIKLRKELFTFNYNDIKYQCFNESINPYIKYFTKKIEAGDFDNYDYIALSIPTVRELLPALTLARLLKEKINTKVVMGGNLATRVKDAFINNPEIFDIFIDALSVCDGEDSIIEFAKYVEGKIDISEVSNLIYKNNAGLVIQNELRIYNDIQNRALPSLKGLDFTKYWAPEIYFTIQSSKGCYWNKCTFCDYSYGKPVYSFYSIDKLINEIIYLKNTYNIKLFEFIDEALRLDYFEKFCDKLIELKLDIKIYCFFRLEKGFTQELFDKFHKAGVVAIQWGYEATSERIMKLMNKGIDPSKRLEILKMSAKAGIWNRIFGIAQFPTETEDEIIQTINTIAQNEDIIHSFALGKFEFSRYAPLLEMQQELNISRVVDSQEFSPTYDYIADKNYGPRAEKLYVELKKKNSHQFWTTCGPDEYLLYYLSRYPLNVFKKMRK